MANNKRTGFTEGSIKSFKALSSNLSLPQFLIAGDSANVVGKVLNYLSDSIAVKRTFSLNDSLVNDNIISLRNSRIDTFLIVAPPEYSLKNLNILFKKQMVILTGKKEVFHYLSRAHRRLKASLRPFKTILPLHYN